MLADALDVPRDVDDRQVVERHRVEVHREAAPLLQLTVGPQVDHGVQVEGPEHLDVGGRAPLQTVGPVEGAPARDPAVRRRIAAEVTEVVDGFEDQAAVGFGDGGHDVRGYRGQVSEPWPVGDAVTSPAVIRHARRLRWSCGRSGDFPRLLTHR